MTCVGHQREELNIRSGGKEIKHMDGSVYSLEEWLRRMDIQR